MRSNRAISLLLLLCTGTLAQNNFQCPRDHRTVVTDAAGEQYIVGCGDDTAGSSNRNAVAANGFNDCFSLCSADPTTCGAVTYVGGSNGVGRGTCYLKAAQYPTSFAGNTDASFVGLVTMRYYAGPTGTSSGALPQETFACPAQDGQVVRDLSGVQYVLGCYQDTAGGAFANQQVSNGFDGCFYYCSNNIRGNCTYFTFVGSANSLSGVGTCWLKLGSKAAFMNRDQSWVGAIQLDSYGGAAISYGVTTTTTAPPRVTTLAPRQNQALSTVYYTTVQYVTTTVVTSYPVTATSVSTRLVTFTSSVTVTATRITTLPDVTTTLQLTSIVPTTVVTTQIYTTVVSTITTLQLTTVVPTTVVTTRFGTTVQVTTIVNTQTTTIIPVVTVTPTTVFGQTITVTPSFS